MLSGSSSVYLADIGEWKTAFTGDKPLPRTIGLRILNRVRGDTPQDIAHARGEPWSWRVTLEDSGVLVHPSPGPKAPHYVNLTPHGIVVFEPHTGNGIVIPPSGSELRIIGQTSLREVLPDGTQVYVSSPGGMVLSGTPLDGLEPDEFGAPHVIPGRVLIVSSVVLDHVEAAGRSDMITPFGLVRDHGGAPIACTAFRGSTLKKLTPFESEGL